MVGSSVFYTCTFEVFTKANDKVFVLRTPEGDCLECSSDIKDLFETIAATLCTL